MPVHTHSPHWQESAAPEEAVERQGLSVEILYAALLWVKVSISIRNINICIVLIMCFEVLQCFYDVITINLVGLVCQLFIGTLMAKNGRSMGSRGSVEAKSVIS